MKTILILQTLMYAGLMTYFSINHDLYAEIVLGVLTLGSFIEYKFACIIPLN